MFYYLYCFVCFSVCMFCCIFTVQNIWCCLPISVERGASFNQCCRSIVEYRQSVDSCSIEKILIVLSIVRNQTILLSECNTIDSFKVLKSSSINSIDCFRLSIVVYFLIILNRAKSIVLLSRIKSLTLTLNCDSIDSIGSTAFRSIRSISTVACCRRKLSILKLSTVW